MKASQTTLSPQPLLTFQELTIPPSRVWVHLTKDQQHHLLETIVLVCQEIVATLVGPQESEVTSE